MTPSLPSQRRSSPTDGVASSTLLVVLGLAIALGAAAYIFSDTFRAKADQTIRSLTEWTPEAIAKNPSGYLDFAEQRIERTRDSLRDAEVVVRQHQAKLEGMKTRQAKRIGVGTTEIESLKALYREAAKSGSWPITYHDRPLSKSEAETQLIALDKSVRSSQGVSASLNQTKEQLDRQTQRLQRALADCEDQIGRVRAHRERLAAKQLADAQAELIGLHEDLVATVEVLGQENKIRTLDELVLEQEDRTQTKQIAEILGQ